MTGPSTFLQRTTYAACCACKIRTRGGPPIALNLFTRTALLGIREGSALSCINPARNVAQKTAIFRVFSRSPGQQSRGVRGPTSPSFLLFNSSCWSSFLFLFFPSISESPNTACPFCHRFRCFVGSLLLSMYIHDFLGSKQTER